MMHAGSQILTDADMVRVIPLPGSSVPSNAPPYSIELTGANGSEIQILDEALLYRPIVAKKGLPHRALGAAQMQVESNRFILSNLRASDDGVSIQVGETDTGICLGTEAINFQPSGTELMLSAIGTLVSGGQSSLGWPRCTTMAPRSISGRASMRSVRRIVSWKFSTAHD
jgi:hypothetical protein